MAEKERYPVVLTALSILNILKEESDFDHPITKKYLADRLGCDWKKIAKTLKLMSTDMYTQLLTGADFSYGEIRGKGIYYEKGDADFDLYEIRMLIDSVLASKVISAKETKSLTEKLSLLLNQHERKHVRHIHTYKDFSKTDHEDMFGNIEILDEAIENYHQVSFDYNEYTIDKKLAKIASYRISPYQLVFTNGQYIVLAKTDADEEIHSFRIDRMSNIVPIAAHSDCPNLIDHPDAAAAAYIEGHPYMCIGKTERIEMKLKESAIGRAIDAFGKNISVSYTDADLADDEVLVRFKANTEDVFRWALQNADVSEIVSPQSVRGRLADISRQMRRRYLSTEMDWTEALYNDIQSRPQLLRGLRTSDSLVRKKLLKENTGDKVKTIYIDTFDESILKEMAHYPNVKKLEINCGEVRDLSFVKHFPHLKVLHIYCAEGISDLSPLLQCPELTHITLIHVPFADGSVFGELPNLTYLTLHHTKLTNIRFMEKAKKLLLFDCHDSCVTDYSPLYKTKNLLKLSLDCTALETLDVDRLQNESSNLMVQIKQTFYPKEEAAQRNTAQVLPSYLTMYDAETKLPQNGRGGST